MTTWTHRHTAEQLGITGRLAVRSLVFDPRRAALHLAVAFAVAAVYTANNESVAWWSAAWVALAVGDLGLALAWRRLTHDTPADAAAALPPASGIVMTGSISSTVRLDYDAGTAEKSYEPTRAVRALYRLSFQAPFPYRSNMAAVRAAALRREVAGRLTGYWFGENLVAPALEVRTTADGRAVFVTELVRGTAPRNIPAAKALLAELTTRFAESGLPTWQVGSYNPRSVGNLIEREDGAFRIIDLESNLVTPILPPRQLARAVRAGLYPSFDEIDVRRLDAYLSAERDSIVATLGDEGAAELFAAASAYAAAQAEWHASEPRIASKLLRFAFRLVDVPSWVRGARRLTQGSEQLADSFTRNGIAAWEAEGRLTSTEADRLRDSLALPEVSAATANLGAHMAMTVPLRFPLGSIARAGWTLVMRARGEWNALRGRGAGSAREVHTLPVALAALVPGAGAFAYALAKPLRKQRAIGAIALDEALRHVTRGGYRTLHFDALTLWMARPANTIARFPRRRRIAAAVPQRLGALRAGLPATVAVVAAASTAIATAAWLEVPGMTATRGLALAAAGAGAAGLLAFRGFWRRDGGADLDQAAGMFLWGGGALLLLGMGIDYGFGVHAAVFEFTATHANVFPMLTDPSEHLVTMTYAGMAVALAGGFRHELLASRASATFLAVALAAGATLAAATLAGVDGAPLAATRLVAGIAMLIAFVTRAAEVHHRPAAEDAAAIELACAA
ncbi:MAG: hypothetical protein IT303_04260 [Dehalococcoidia bacterium]|nr:hypothetical protein [Dehalococcoidia bacterium]